MPCAFQVKPIAAFLSFLVLLSGDFPSAVLDWSCCPGGLCPLLRRGGLSFACLNGRLLLGVPLIPRRVSWMRGLVPLKTVSYNHIWNIQAWCFPVANVLELACLYKKYILKLWSQHFVRHMYLKTVSKSNHSVKKIRSRSMPLLCRVCPLDTVQ